VGSEESSDPDKTEWMLNGVSEDVPNAANGEEPWVLRNDFQLRFSSRIDERTESGDVVDINEAFPLDVTESTSELSAERLSMVSILG